MRQMRIGCMRSHASAYKYINASYMRLKAEIKSKYHLENWVSETSSSVEQDSRQAESRRELILQTETDPTLFNKN